MSGQYRADVTRGRPGLPGRPGGGQVPALRAGTVPLACLALVAACAGPDNDPPPPTDTVEVLTHTWTSGPAELSPEAATGTDLQIVIHPDGAFTGPSVIVDEDAWIVTLADGDGMPVAVVGIDPATGAPRWEQQLGEVLCGDAVIDGVIMCVSHYGDLWHGHVIDASTGAIRSTWATGLASAATVHQGAAGLIVVGANEPESPHVRISLLTREGTTAWSVDLADVPGGDTLFSHSPDDSERDDVLERPRWRQLDGGLDMLWSTDGAAIIDAATGAVFAHECPRATVAGSAYYCATDAGITRHALDGSVVWTLAGLTLAHPPDQSPSWPVAYDEASHEVVGVDWENGAVTQPLATLEQTTGSTSEPIPTVSVSGDLDHPVVTGGSSLVALGTDLAAVTWTWSPEDGGSVGSLFAIGDLLVRDNLGQTAFDAATGAELWTARIETGVYRQVVGDQLVSIGGDGIALVDLP